MFETSGCTSTVICRWRLTSLNSPARAFITFVSYVSCAGVSPRTQLTRSSEHLFTVGSTIATECWLAYHRLRYSDQQASIHPPCSSSPCAAATRLGQCLESDACAAPLAFHSTEDSVQAVLGGVQVSSQHVADILTRSLRAYLVF